MEKNPEGENIMNVWKDHTTEVAIVGIEKATEAIKPETVHSCCKSCAQMLYMTSHNLGHSQSGES